MVNQNNQIHTKILFWRRIALVLFGLFLTLIFIELGLRLAGFTILSLQEYRNRISIQKKGTYRIMCLGESTTADQYPSFLEEILNQRNISITFSVIDKGRASTITPVIVNELESNLDEYHPDMVVTMMGINDLELNIPYETISDSPKVSNFLKSFRVCKLTRLLLLHIIAKFKEAEKEHTEEVDFSVNKEIFKNDVELNCKSDDVYNTYIELGVLYNKQGKFSEVEELFKKAIELAPENDRAYTELGILYYHNGSKFSEVEELFKKAIESAPENARAYIELGRFYRRQGKFSEAEESFKKAIELEPESADKYIELGLLYRSRKDKFSEAEELFKKAIELYPERADAYIELGTFYCKQGKFSEAEELFKKAIELEPEGERAYRVLSILYEDIGKLELAEKYDKKMNYYNPITVNSYHQLKEILDKREKKLVCVQYPIRSIEPLRKMFKGQEGIIFVDNERLFKEAVRKDGYEEYFWDMFGGDFGHCTKRGNKLLAENIANVILKEVFGKPNSNALVSP